MSQVFTTSKYSFTRPTADHAAYGNTDLIANSVTAADVVPLKFSTSRVHGKGRIMAATLFKDSEVVTAATFLLHLFNSAPSLAVGDADAFAVASARPLIAQVAMDCSSGSLVTSTDLKKRFALSVPAYFDLEHISPSARIIYGLLQAQGTYDPTSGELFEVELELEGWAR